MARKVVEHTGHTGEHYIALTRAEWRRTFRSAAGGGVLTAGTALGKYAIAAAALAPLAAGMGFAGNYAASFVAMQFLGMTLASKQPAMTAASLAGVLEGSVDRNRLEHLVAGITRSQAMATLGNVLAAIPATLALALLWRWVAGHPSWIPATAAHSLHGLHPFRSWTIPFAALTGVMLWMSSLVAGWAANWSAYRRLPEALATHRRLHYWLGPRGAEWIGRMTERHFSGVAGYLALGFLLGFTPVALAFAGSTWRSATSPSTRPPSPSAPCRTPRPGGTSPGDWRASSSSGSATSGCPSALALRTAMRARGVEGERNLFLGLVRRMVREPGRFLGPPEEE